MSDTKPVEKPAKPVESPLLSISLEPAEKAATKFRREAHDQTRETAAHKTEPVSWRNELQTATKEIKQLEQLKTGDPASAKDRKDLIQSIDRHFQKALPLVQQDATSADSELLKSVAKVTGIEKSFDHFELNGKTIDAKTAKMDDIHNAILNAKDEPTRNQLSRLALSVEARNTAMNQVDESYFKTKAPMMAALDYANFLVKYKDGVTQNPAGGIFTASAVLENAMTPEMAASPQGKQITRLANDCNPFVPAEKNPLYVMREAMTEQDPKKALDILQHAATLAKDKFFDHDNLQNQINLEKAKNDNSPSGQAKIVALETFSHARAQAEAALGLAQLANGKNGDAVGHLLTAAKDPSAAEFVAETMGKTTFSNLLVAAVTRSEPNFESSSQAFLKADKDALTHYNNYIDLDNKKDFDGSAKELKLAGASADEAIKNARAIKAAIGDENGKKIKEDFDALAQKVFKKEPLSAEEKSLLETLSPLVQAQSFETDALYKKARIDIAAHNHNAAVSELEALQKLDPTFVANKDVKADFDAQMKLAKDGAEYDNAAWYKKGWILGGDLAGHAWEFAKTHEKMIAGTVAFGAAAIAVEVGSLGTGTPVAIALAAAAIGTATGTAAGAGLEYASGRNTNLLRGALDVAPSAFTGAVLGTAGMGAFKAASFGTTPLTMFASNSIRGSLLAAAPSFYFAKQNYESGKDKTLAAAVGDFAFNDLSMGVGGALVKAPLWTAKIVGTGLFAAPFVAEPLRDYYSTPSPSTRIQPDSVTLPEATSKDQNDK